MNFYRLKSVCILFVICVLTLNEVKAQDPIGLPQVSSFSGVDYMAGTQNWGIAQDKRGLLYFANNEGLLTYNGEYWKLHKFPNKTIIRSIKINQDGKIFVGAQDEIGYYFPNYDGILVYKSLKFLIPVSERQFADVWNIEINGDDIYFRTVSKIFRYKNNKIDVFSTQLNWAYLGKANNEILAQEISIGLKVFKNGKWTIKCTDKKIINSTIISCLPYSKDTLLVTTLKDGLFLLTGNKLIAFKTNQDNIFFNDRIGVAIKLNTNLYAIGTTSSALLIIDKKGVLQRQFSYAEGLSNNNIRSILLDQHQNLWLGLDDGIAFIAFNSAIKNIYPDRNKQVASYASRIFEQKLYIGTSNGLFSAPIKITGEDISNSKSKFTEVKNTKGQTWGLTEINQHLYLANEEGALQIKGNERKQFFKGLGTWIFKPFGEITQEDQIVVGTYKGLHQLSVNKNEISTKKLALSVDESLRFIAVDKKVNCIWASHPYRGIYKMDLSADGQTIIKTSLLTEKDGLPLKLYNYVFALKDRIVVATSKGIYEFNSQTKKFNISSFFKPIFKKMQIQFLVEDKLGKIWFISDKKAGVVDFNQNYRKQNFKIVEFPELNLKTVAGFENIYPYNDNNVFIGANKGLIHLNYNKYVANLYKPNIILGEIKLLGKTDSVIFGGYIDENSFKLNKFFKKLSFKYNSLHFEFSSSLFEQKENIEYSYQLKGYEDDWSIWGNKSEKDYTNLAHGSYTFQVKARNNLGNESNLISYSFYIAPPWYKSLLAYFIYFILLIVMIYITIQFQKRAHHKVQNALKQKHQLEIERNEQQITKLQKKQLEADVEFKNKELATTTMHLVQRGKLLSKIGDELMPLVQQSANNETAKDLKKVLRLLNEAKRLDNDWNQFAIHFDQVHANFLTNLKEKYTNLSPNDLKLCAYLKLNLSSKEIAQLLNITPRAVEVSRYRLRKKLGLKPEMNLFDFLFK